MTTTKYMDFVKYGSTAMALKLLSISPSFYRLLGNQLGARRRSRLGIPSYYGKRAETFLSLYKKHQMVQDNDPVIEIGTGWIHFESLVMRLFYDVEVTLFDVWDNRQFEAFQKCAVQLEEMLYQEMELTQTEQERIRHLVELIVEADSFETAYKHLNFRYSINGNGTLDSFPNESFQLAYSFNVLEHVDRETVPMLLQDFYRVLKPGGFLCHEIDITDHLISFARIQGMPRKYYLRFSDKTWKRFFENKVQYFNRIQCSEWLDLFEQTGLELVEKTIITDEIDDINVSKTYENLDKQDIDCKRLRVIYQKPFNSSE